MDTIIAIELAGVVTAWAVLGYMIWRWGPGLRKRSVRCPSKGVRATVLADQREAEFACLRVADVVSCSLAPGSSFKCRKECLGRI